MTSSTKLKPMPLRLSILYFGIPTALGLISIYGILPAVAERGPLDYWRYTLILFGVLPLLLVAALAAYRLEGRSFSVADFRDRFRLHGLSRSDWTWTLGLLVVYLGGNLLLTPSARWLITTLPLPVPAGLPPSIDPRIPQAAIPTEYLGASLRGNWETALTFLVLLFFNIMGEELWWRGIVLPRQELVHGKWTWLVHGVLWTLFHVPFWWNLIALLPSTLSLSYVTSRLRNTTPGIIVHLTMNGLGYLMLVLGVIGIES